MFLQGLPPPPPPPPGLSLENEIMLIVLALIFGLWIICKDEFKNKKNEHTQHNQIDE